VFLEIAQKNNSEIYFASDSISSTFPSDLKGDYQEQNKKTVLLTIQILNSQKTFNVTEDNIKAGLLHVVKNTGLYGRWQQINDFPKAVCDTAHNKHGLQITLKQVQNEKFDSLHIVLGVVNDKDLADILPLFPKKACYYFCKPNIPRGLDATLLQQKASTYQLKGQVFNSVSEAYAKALQSAQPSDFIYVGGSTFVVAEIF
jgi:dihydrofolate synthase/folylpolyglutamate synthase